jgi:hypothetical protein
MIRQNGIFSLNNRIGILSPGLGVNNQSVMQFTLKILKSAFNATEPKPCYGVNMLKVTIFLLK